MPNERNVEALEKIILEGIDKDLQKFPRVERMMGEAFRQCAPGMARYFASRGVLAVSDEVLTDDVLPKMVLIHNRSTSPEIMYDSCDDFRQVLTRIARGEEG